MPGRNVVKQHVAHSYYHIYNRGVNKRAIFIDDRDYRVFLSILKRYLSKKRISDSSGRVYESFFEQIDLLCFCLMPNHFHLFIYQKDNPEDMQHLVQKISVAYTAYFNKRHRRVGSLFQGKYRAKRVMSEQYLLHITRYIHLNPKNYRRWEWSSLPYYFGDLVADWVKLEAVTNLFKHGSYNTFLLNYEGHKEALNTIKSELADQ